MTVDFQATLFDALGDGPSDVPVLGYGSGPLEGQTVASLAAGMNHCVALFSSGRVAAWGDNGSGQLGNGSIIASDVPVSVTTSQEGRMLSAVTGSSASHVLSAVGWDRPISNAPQQTAAPALLSWRQLHFGDETQHDKTADDADFDADGIPNLVEYAFGSDPKTTGGTGLPEARVKDGYLVIEFTASEETLGVSFGATWSTQPSAGTWREIADEGQGDHHLFRIPLDGNHGFMRLHVTAH